MTSQEKLFRDTAIATALEELLPPSDYYSENYIIKMQQVIASILAMFGAFGEKLGGGYENLSIAVASIKAHMLQSINGTRLPRGAWKDSGQSESWFFPAEPVASPSKWVELQANGIVRFPDGSLLYTNGDMGIPGGYYITKDGFLSIPQSSAKKQETKTQTSSDSSRAIDWLEVPTFAKTADDLLARAAELTNLRRHKIEPLLDFLQRDLAAQKPRRIIVNVILAILEHLNTHHQLHPKLLRACQSDSLAHCSPGKESGTNNAFACLNICDYQVKPPPPGVDLRQYAAPPADYTQRVLHRVAQLMPSYIEEIPEDWYLWAQREGLPVPPRGPQTIDPMKQGQTQIPQPAPNTIFAPSLDLTSAQPVSTAKG